MLIWRDEGHRIVAVCGELDVGYVFPPTSRETSKCRWRLNYTAGACPMEVKAGKVDDAKDALQRHFNMFLFRARLAPMIDWASPEGQAILARQWEAHAGCAPLAIGLGK